MKIMYQIGDLLSTKAKWLLHSTNAQGAMNSGIAKVIRERYPVAYSTYKASYRAGALKLGSINYVEVDGKTIINGTMQQFYGYDGKRYVDYDAVASVIGAVSDLVGDGSEVAMPLVGADRGGGDWKTLVEIIEAESKAFQPVVYLLSMNNLPASVTSYFENLNKDDPD